MLVDLHLHESTYSSDSKMTLQEMVEDARAKGLDGICVTDHDSMGGVLLPLGGYHRLWH